MMLTYCGTQTMFSFLEIIQDGHNEFLGKCSATFC